MPLCTIVIKDEVNCRLDGLSMEAKKKLARTFEFEVPGARYLPAVRLGRWNGKTSFFQMGGSTYVNLLPQIIPILEEYNYDFELDDRREYSISFDFERVDENTFSHKKWPKGHVCEGQPVVFRDYQIELINNYIANLQSVQIAPTGAGKTLVTAGLSYCVEKYGRSIIIVPNKDLVKQTYADYINLGLDTGVYFGDRKELGKTHTICTWQSVLQVIKNTQNGEGDLTIQDFLEDVVCVICDEVHGAKGDQLKSMLSGCMSHIPIRWGLTGTMPKEEQSALTIELCIGPVINKLKASELQEKGVLSSCHVNIIQTVEHREFGNYQSELKFLLEDKDRVVAIAQLLEKIRTTGNTLVLVDRIAAGNALEALLSDSVFVSGETKGSTRQTEYNSISEAEDKIIIATYQVAAVGINIPRLFNVVLIEPGKSFVRTIQSIGRGLRKAHDKDSVIIWDITSSCKFSKRHLASRKEYYREFEYPYTQEKHKYN